MTRCGPQYGNRIKLVYHPSTAEETQQCLLFLMRNKRSLCLALLAQLRSYRSMPTEKQLLEQAKQLQGQTSATDEAPVTIVAALLLADTIRAAGSCAPREPRDVAPGSRPSRWSSSSVLKPRNTGAGLTEKPCSQKSSPVCNLSMERHYKNKPLNCY